MSVAFFRYLRCTCWLPPFDLFAVSVIVDDHFTCEVSLALLWLFITPVDICRSLRCICSSIVFITSIVSVRCLNWMCSLFSFIISTVFLFVVSAVPVHHLRFDCSLFSLYPFNTSVVTCTSSHRISLPFSSGFVYYVRYSCWWISFELYDTFFVFIPSACCTVSLLSVHMFIIFASICVIFPSYLFVASVAATFVYLCRVW